MVSDYYTGHIPLDTNGATTIIKKLNKPTINNYHCTNKITILSEWMSRILVGPILRKGQFLTISISTYNF